MTSFHIRRFNGGETDGERRGASALQRSQHDFRRSAIRQVRDTAIADSCSFERPRRTSTSINECAEFREVGSIVAVDIAAPIDFVPGSHHKYHLFVPELCLNIRQARKMVLQQPLELDDIDNPF
jgi:hypothetical protein